MSNGLSNILLKLVSFSTGFPLLFALFSLFFFSPAHFKTSFYTFQVMLHGRVTFSVWLMIEISLVCVLIH